MFAPTVFQNLPHNRTVDFERKKERGVYYEFQGNSFKHGVFFDDVGAIINRPQYHKTM